MTSLDERTNQRVYINNALGKNVNGMIGPVTSRMTRCIFAQAKKGSGYFLVGETNLNGQLISDKGADNNADARKVLAAIQ